MIEPRHIRAHLVCWVLALHVGQVSVAQESNLGIPPVRNFSKKIYQAGTQNWDAAQDGRGVLFFANNEGLLQFDGSHWACHPVANKTVVRSVAIDPEGRIFVGAQSELGYFFPTANGQLRYHSLVALLPPDKRNFEDVWDIAVVGKAVFFRTQRAVLQLLDNRISIHEPGGDLTAMFATPRGLLVQKDLSEILLFENNGFRPLFQAPELASELTGMMRWQGDTLLFSSLKNGLFHFSGNQFARWRTTHDALFREKRIYTSTTLPDGHLALGTSLDGFVEIDLECRIFRHLNKKNGLQNNNVLHTFADRAGNLWLGLDNGIDCALLHSPFTSVIPDADLQGTGYAAAVFDRQLFLGVSNGVYRTPWRSYFDPEKRPYYEKIGSTDGQVWTLHAAGDALLLGHHEGSFRLAGQVCSRISSEPGAWTFVRLTDDYLLGGNYAGLVLYRKSGKNWVFDQKLNGLNESCRFMVRDADGSIWVAHPYRGLFRVEWSAERKSELRVQFFNAQNGLPSDLNNLVFSLAGKAVFATEKGVFRFDKQLGAFVPDEDFERLLGKDNPVKYLREDAEGRIWFVAGKEVGVLTVDDFGLKKEIRKQIFPELTGKLVAGFEFVFPLDEANVFFGAEQGFIHFNAAQRSRFDTVLQVVLGQVVASGTTRDSVLFGGWFVENGRLANEQGRANLPILEAGMNTLRFAFSATHFDDPALLQYRFRMDGLGGGWSEWSSENTQNFMHLRPGTYRFEVQARQKNGRESGVLAFTFRIRPPWYASAAALTAYALCFLGFFAGFLIRQRRKFEREKESLTVQHQQITAEQQRRVEESKAALTDVLKEKLEAEIQFKNKELATATMHLVQKGEILQTIQENLNHILEKSTNPAVKKEIQQLLNLLNFDAKLDEDWEQFAVHFDQVHVDFLKRLRDRYPQLSPTDCKLCAYLRMNLTTKEIAPLMNVSVRGVEASRYRLRKKLGLPNDANLTEVIARL
ncbi:MAG: hypothetical protein KF734_00710 [Saprospiraceae bacterium]|nr:hypothetical protein [Saprospiraceae bacterium]